MRGGHGGRGSASFRHEPFTPRGGPDGGDGGEGGSVVIQASAQMTDLAMYARRRQWAAEAGANGAGGRKTGRGGKDLVLEVPVGTVVIATDGDALADIDHASARSVIAKGGRGGRGNIHFKSSTRQAPDRAEPGEAGEELQVTLDLKLIADAGLVGPPNAGKSSLLAALTAARPKVAPYPFTTLDPALGVAESAAGRIVIADIPGLVEGASHGAGLGLEFLRHVERTRVLVFVVDGSAPDPWSDLRAVRTEVERFSTELATRPHIVAVNKVDLEPARRLRARTRRKGVHFISARTGEGLPLLMTAVVAALKAAPPSRSLAVIKKVTLAPPVRGSGITVERKPWGFAVSGTRVERLVARTDLDSEGSLEHFQVVLDRIGVNAALEAEGVRPGDTVRIGSAEFEYQP